MSSSSERNRLKQNPEIAAFLAQLETIPWFVNLGKPIPLDAETEQMSAWDKWPGAEDPAVTELHSRQQALYDEIINHSDQQREVLSRLWETIQGEVLRLATKHIPYDPNKDTWYPPNAAVWHAAWTAALIGLYSLLDRPIPSELQKQWSWFTEGHWPCAWAGEFPRGKLVVF